ncbi:hypothetical protein GW17_00010762 [Ensete ventricosum]|nr:hypothetical protein GW17_00010762 [Ensete ventricosum]
MAGLLRSVPPPAFRLPSPPGGKSIRRRTGVSAEIRETVEIEGERSPSPKISPPPGFKPPEPKRFSVRPDKFLDILGASLALPFRLGTGVFVLGEIVSILDLDVLYYPCPRNGPNFRPKVLQMGGKQQFPYMGSSYSPSKLPPMPLEIWAYEMTVLILKF